MLISRSSVKLNRLQNQSRNWKEQIKTYVKPPSLFALESSYINKTLLQIIKQSTATLLTSPPYRMRKADPDFKDVFQWIYRGVSFALVGCCFSVLYDLVMTLMYFIQRKRMKEIKELEVHIRQQGGQS